MQMCCKKREGSGDGGGGNQSSWVDVVERTWVGLGNVYQVLKVLLSGSEKRRSVNQPGEPVGTRGW